MEPDTLDVGSNLGTWYEITFDVTERQHGRFKHPGNADQAMNEFVEYMTGQGLNCEIVSIFPVEHANN